MFVSMNEKFIPTVENIYSPIIFGDFILSTKIYPVSIFNPFSHRYTRTYEFLRHTKNINFY